MMNPKHILFISDLLKAPYDEGQKVVAKNILAQIKKYYNDSQVSLIKNKLYSFIAVNSLLFNKADFILYLPKASITFNSFLRAKIISILSRKNVFMISTQPRIYKSWQKYILPYIQPYALFVQSKKHCTKLKNYGLTRVFINSWAVDISKFCCVDKKTKENLRRKYNVPNDKKVYLHFGHLKNNRNFNELEVLLKDDDNYVLVVCSTTTKQNINLKNKLTQKGFHFITKYIRENQELYQLSDYYVFPALEPISAIEFPLSVFEALACGIPVFHKPFGALEDIFLNKYTNLRQYNKPEELKEINFNSNNPFPINDYVWEKVIKDMISQLEKIND